MDAFRYLLMILIGMGGILGGGGAGHPGAEAAERRDQIEAIESQLSEEREKFKKFDDEEKDLLALLSRLEQEVSEKKDLIERLKRRIRASARTLEDLKEQDRAFEARVRGIESRMAKRLVMMYKYARQGYFRVLASSSDLNELWQRAKYLSVILKQDRQAMDRLLQEKREAAEKRSRLKTKMDRKKAELGRQEARLTQAKQELDQKVVRLMKVHKEKEFYQTAVKELELAAKDLKNTMDQIEQRGRYTEEGAERFSEAKGSLPYPVAGKIVDGKALAAAAGMERKEGVLIQSGKDASVRAVFPGRVDFSGRLKGYGEVVIVNHGSRYFTITAHLSQRQKEEGDVVRGGDVIGWVRGDGSSMRPWLYFEIRRGDKHLEVAQWLKKGG